MLHGYTRKTKECRETKIHGTLTWKADRKQVERSRKRSDEPIKICKFIKPGKRKSDSKCKSATKTTIRICKRGQSRWKEKLTPVRSCHNLGNTSAVVVYASSVECVRTVTNMTLGCCVPKVELTGILVHQSKQEPLVFWVSSGSGEGFFDGSFMFTFRVFICSTAWTASQEGILDPLYLVAMGIGYSRKNVDSFQGLSNRHWQGRNLAPRCLWEKVVRAPKKQR